MTRNAYPLALLSAMLACSLFTAPAHARARVFVASYGNDSNPCTFLSPCKTFQIGVNTVDAGGEVTAIDSAGFGPIGITKAVTITSPDGVEAGIVPVSGGNAITIHAGSTDAIVLHGLTLNGSGVGANGIVFNSGASLSIADCAVRNMTGNGLAFFPNVTTTTTLAVSNSYFNNNGNSAMFISPNSSGAITASIERTGFYANPGTGLVVNGNSGTGALTVAVTDSVAANNGNGGFLVESSAAGSVSNLSLTHSLAEGNAFGVVSGGANATLWLAQSTVTGNSSAGFEALIGVINTFQDNYFSNNGPNIGSLAGVGKL